MSSINRATAREIGDALQAALQPVAEQFGLTVEIRGGTFDAQSFKPKIEFKTADADEQDFRTYADMYGLDPDDFGREFTSQGKRFKVSGLAHRSRVRPILCTEISIDRVYKFTVEGVKLALSKAVA